MNAKKGHSQSADNSQLLAHKSSPQGGHAFKLKAPYKPTGDQPQAIAELVKGFKEGNQCQTLLGVTGSGKTFTMANVIQQLQKPTLVIAHNKTLAAQLYGEFKEMFPENAVEYFVSYYDYYQPEAYVPSSDTYIAKDSARNDEIDKLRLSATSALSERKDVIVVSSVSCIYGIGSPKDYMEMIISLRPGMEKDRDDVIRQLIDIQYDRNDMDFHRGTFRVRGDVLEIFPAEETDKAVRVEFFGDEIDRLVQIDTLTGEILCELNHIAIFPASHYVVPMDTILKATGEIEKDMEEQVKFFKHEGKLIEAQRIEERMKEQAGADNDVLAAFVCQGKMPVSVRYRYEELLKDEKMKDAARAMIANFDHALSHPDETDLKQAEAFALRVAAMIDAV